MYVRKGRLKVTSPFPFHVPSLRETGYRLLSSAVRSSWRSQVVLSSSGQGGLIGIGRSLATPLLPHHPAYGSRTRAVRQIQSRSMRSIEPRQPKFLKIAGRKGKGKGRTSAQSPRAMRGFAGVPRKLTTHTALDQLSISSPTPLFPLVTPEPTPYPRVNFLEHRLRFRKAEILVPASEILPQVIYYRLRGNSTSALRPLTDFLLASLQSLRTHRAPVRPPTREAETKDAPPPWPINRALGRVDRKLQRALKKPCHTHHHPLASTLAPDIDVAVICIANETVSPLLKLSVQSVQQQVRKQGRERPSLGCSLKRRLNPIARHRSCLEIPANQLQHPPI